MSAPKKRKSDVHNDIGISGNGEHPHTKKEKHWFEENEPENRRGSIFKGLLKKMRSSSTLKNTNHAASTSKLEKQESLANDTHASITSESSVTSIESNATLPNVNKNAGLRTFVNRDSFTPVPPENQDEERLDIPTAGSSKHEAQSRMEDAISVNSHMSVDSTNTVDEDSVSIGSASAFCTPSRNPLHRSGIRMSTRSVPDWDEQPPLFRSLCNSAVRRVPTSKSEGGFGSTPMRRSMRMSMQKRVLNSTSMEDVPEEEALTISSSSVIRLDAPIAEEEQFEGAKDFFANNVQEPNDESLEDGHSSRLSTSSDTRKSTGGGSVGRKNSIFRKMFSSNKHEQKERRMSEVFSSDIQEASMMPRGRRASIVSFTNDCSFDVGVNQSASVTSLASNDSSKLKMRKKHPSTSNLTQRISSVFRRTSTSAFKDDEVGETRSRRNTLTGFSSISSGIGSIASGISDSASFNTTALSGQSISRNGSKREDESKRERSRRLLDRIVISDIPAAELLRLKLEQVKRREHAAVHEQFETQLNESGSSTSSQLNELLSFDVVAVDVYSNGAPFSTVAATMIDEEIAKTVRSEVSYRPDRCGSITDCEPDLIFVCQEPGQCIARSANESINSTADTNTDLLRNVRSGLCKSIEEWKKLSTSRESSTMLIYPMFCQSEAEWDSKATIDAIFLMLDGILQNARRWHPNGKCVLAGLSANNTRLLREKYEEVRQSVAVVEPDAHSIASNSTIFG